MIKPLTNHQGISVSFVTSMECSLACRYCYEFCKKPAIEWDKEFWKKTGLNEAASYPRTNTPPTLLGIETAKTFIDKLVTTDIREFATTETIQNIAKQGIILDFIGGDSMQMPELVDEILTYWCQRIWKDDIAEYQRDGWRSGWRANISCNGVTLLNTAARRIAEKWKNVLSLGISIDGCPELHDLNRILFKKDKLGGDIGSSKYIFQIPVDGFGSVFEWWRHHFPQQSISSKFTIAPNSYYYLMRSYKWMYKNGFKYISSNRVMENNMVDTKLQRKILDDIFSYLYNFVKDHRDEIYALPFDYNFHCQPNGSLQDIQRDDPDYHHCGLGSMLALHPDGKIYSCFRLINGHSDYDTTHLSIGTAAAPYSNKKTMETIRYATAQTRYYLPLECQTCPILKTCPTCIAGELIESRPDNLNNFKMKKQVSACHWHKLQTYYSLKYWRTELEERKQHYVDDGQDYEIWWDREYEENILMLPEAKILL
jgi:uncharacterized protein